MYQLNILYCCASVKGNKITRGGLMPVVPVVPVIRNYEQISLRKKVASRLPRYSCVKAFFDTIITTRIIIQNKSCFSKKS